MWSKGGEWHKKEVLYYTLGVPYLYLVSYDRWQSLEQPVRALAERISTVALQKVYPGDGYFICKVKFLFFQNLIFSPGSRL